MAAKKRTRKKTSKPARGKKVARKKKAARKSARKSKPVRRTGRAAVSILSRRGDSKPAAHFPEDTLGDWHDAHADEHAHKHDPEDEDFHEIGGSE